MTQSAQFGAPPGCSGAGRPENRVVARSKAPQKKCTGLALPRKPARKRWNRRSACTSASQNRGTDAQAGERLHDLGVEAGDRRGLEGDRPPLAGGGPHGELVAEQVELDLDPD